MLIRLGALLRCSACSSYRIRAAAATQVLAVALNPADAGSFRILRK
jgi:hypothetical protein